MRRTTRQYTLSGRRDVNSQLIGAASPACTTLQVLLSRASCPASREIEINREIGLTMDNRVRALLFMDLLKLGGGVSSGSSHNNAPGSRLYVQRTSHLYERVRIKSCITPLRWRCCEFLYLSLRKLPTCTRTHTTQMFGYRIQSYRKTSSLF